MQRAAVSRPLEQHQDYGGGYFSRWRSLRETQFPIRSALALANEGTYEADSVETRNPICTTSH